VETTGGIARESCAALPAAAPCALGQVYISRNLLRNLMLWLGKRNFSKHAVPEGWVKETFRNIT
jgi:hypothetical protein